MVISWVLLARLLAFLATKPVLGVTLTAILDYGTFQGAYNAEYNLSYWQKIPFAAPPVGVGRFRAPQPPQPVAGIYNSTEAFSACPSREVSRETTPDVNAKFEC